MTIVVDTNVPLVANHKSEQASEDCVIACVRFLRDLTESGTIVVDDGWEIIREYRNKLNENGQPGPGDLFFLWVLTNIAVPGRCIQITISQTSNGASYEEFPDSSELSSFDISDRKFVAVAIGYENQFNKTVPIANAVDKDWWIHREALNSSGIEIDFLCPDDVREMAKNKTKSR